MRIRHAAALLLLLLAHAGCAHPQGPSSAPASRDLAWPTLTVATNAAEPFEQRGHMLVSWSNDLFGVYTEHEDGMLRFAIKQGDTLWLSQNQVGWSRWDRDELARSQDRGFRYQAWDPQGLLAGGRLVSERPDELVAVASLASKAGAGDARVLVNHSGPDIRSIRIDTSLDVESPYTLAPSGERLGFDLRVPQNARDHTEIERLEPQSNQGHAAIIGWIRQYLQQTGRLPDEPNAQSLALQRLNNPWPTNPYGGQPVQRGADSGQFAWTRCGDQDADYLGRGWDEVFLSQSFGRGCRPSSTPGRSSPAEA